MKKNEVAHYPEIMSFIEPQLFSTFRSAGIDDISIFWKSGEFNGYTPVYMYLGPNECKYYLYNPDGEVIAESDRKIYLISYDGNPCYTITKQEWVETASGGHDQFYIDVYDLKTGELVEVPERIKHVTNYMK